MDAGFRHPCRNDEFLAFVYNDEFVGRVRRTPHNLPDNAKACVLRNPTSDMQHCRHGDVGLCLSKQALTLHSLVKASVDAPIPSQSKR